MENQVPNQSPELEPDQVQEPEPAGKHDTATFHFRHSSQHRVIHGDGVWGSITPQGNIAMGFFSDRSTTPDKVIYDVRDGRIGEELDRECYQGFIRELEATVMVTPATANYMVQWLQAHLTAIARNQTDE